MSEQNPAPEAPQPPPPPPPPPQQTFGSAPPGAETVGSAPPPDEPLPKRKSPLPRILLTVAIAAVVLIAGGLWFGRDSTKQAKAGSCIADLPEVQAGQEVKANDAKVVDCTSDEAIYKVEGRIDDKTQAEATADSICAAFASAEFVYYSVPPGGKGYVLCLSIVSR